MPPSLSHCAVNTSAESIQKCGALGANLKRLISFPFVQIAQKENKKISDAHHY